MHCVACGSPLAAGQTCSCKPLTVSPPHYAGFWVRLGAWFIDQIILGFMGFFVGLFLGIFRPSLGTILFVTLMLTWLYYATQHCSKSQATFGKRALGLQVTDSSGNRITFGAATGRFFAIFLSGIFCIGFLMVAFSEKKRGLHDLMAGTQVVYRT